ncbi:MAG: hypothetical protein QXT45_07855 [Candidatus Bilamarchaeaceae archaeon]
MVRGLGIRKTYGPTAWIRKGSLDNDNKHKEPIIKIIRGIGSMNMGKDNPWYWEHEHG